MEKADILGKWKRISAVIEKELESNEAFAETLAQTLSGSSSAPRKRRNRRASPKLDPFALFSVGEEQLSAALATLSVEELKDVISANGMDSAKLALKWKDRARLEKFIVDSTKRKATHGEAFWNTET